MKQTHTLTEMQPSIHSPRFGTQVDMSEINGNGNNHWHRLCCTIRKTDKNNKIGLKAIKVSQNHPQKQRWNESFSMYVGMYECVERAKTI